MQNANTVVALTVHTAFVPSQRLKPRTTGSKSAKICTFLAWIWTASSSFFRLEVLQGFEPWSLDSKSRVLTTTP